jgi:hypothetical protein
MPNAHLRDIASLGVITDVDPYDLPTTAWSLGINVRFKDKKVSRAPVFRNATASLSFTDPRFLAVNTPATGFDAVLIGYKNGRVTETSSGAENDRSIAGYVNADSDSPYTSCFVGSVRYVNRDDRIPWKKAAGDTNFVALANWPSTHRCRILRSYAGTLVALNITKSGQNFPTMVRTGEFVLDGQVPSTWDETDPTNNVTENILADMEGSITDACPLRNLLAIYSRRETWIMSFQPQSEDVFGYVRVFKDAGSVNANCSVEVNSKNYVFGHNDIWMHDGISKASACDERVRKFIFENINLTEAPRFHVFHNEAAKQIHFAYVAGDRAVAFDPGHAKGCNRQAILDYVNNTWTFDDLPYVFGQGTSNLDNLLTYATVTGTYDTIGGTYLDQEDSAKKTTVMVGNTSSADGLTARLYAFDLQGPGSTVSYLVNTAATKGWQLEHTGIDMDEVGADLPGYKLINSVYPQGRLEIGALPIEFSVGANDFPNQNIVWSDWQTYDGNELFKLDFNVTGRYLAFRIRHLDYHWITLSGFDFDIDVLADY